MRKDIKEFETIYTLYYDEAPEYIIEDKSIRVAKFKYVLSLRSVEQINEFFGFRIKNGKTHSDPITEEDYTYIDNKLKNKRMYRQVVCVLLNISYNSFDLAYRTHGNLRSALKHMGKKERPVSVYQEAITWQNETKTIIEWAKSIGITVQQFRVRHINLGVCEELFYSTDDFRKFIKENDGPLLTKQVEGTLAGTEEWQALSLKKPSKNPITEKEISTELAANIVTHLILDAKKDIMNKNQYMDSAKKFLLNQDGNLEWLLSANESIDVPSALKHLEQFVRSFEPKSKKQLTKQPRKGNIYKQIAA